jgi:hypothetical protein
VSAVRLKVPDDRTAIGVQRELQDAVAALHFYVLVLVRVFLELAHRRSPRGSVCPWPNLLRLRMIGKQIRRVLTAARPAEVAPCQKKR